MSAHAIDLRQGEFQIIGLKGRYIVPVGDL